MRIQDCEINHIIAAIQSRMPTLLRCTSIHFCLPLLLHSPIKVLEMPQMLSTNLLWCQSKCSAAWGIYTMTVVAWWTLGDKDTASDSPCCRAADSGITIERTTDNELWFRDLMCWEMRCKTPKRQKQEIRLESCEKKIMQAILTTS